MQPDIFGIVCDRCPKSQEEIIYIRS